MGRPKRGERLPSTIDDLAFGGEGVGRADGYVVFVPGGVPGGSAAGPARPGPLSLRPRRDRGDRGALPAPGRGAVSVLRALRRMPAPARGLSCPARVQVQAGRRCARAAGRSRRVRAPADHRGARDLRLPEQDGVHRRAGAAAADPRSSLAGAGGRAAVRRCRGSGRGDRAGRARRDRRRAPRGGPLRLRARRRAVSPAVRRDERAPLARRGASSSSRGSPPTSRTRATGSCASSCCAKAGGRARRWPTS